MNIADFNVEKYDAILARGLSIGIGEPDSRMCIEAAICNVLGLSHSDDPKCVAEAVLAFNIRLNDCRWSSPAARAQGMRGLGLAQLGSLGVVDDAEFVRRLAEKVIRRLIPALFRQVFPEDKACLDAADRCEAEGTRDAASAAYEDAYAAYAATPIAASAAYKDAAYAATVVAAAYAKAANRATPYANIATGFAGGADGADGSNNQWLLLVADAGLEVLRELKSPGIELLQNGE